MVFDSRSKLFLLRLLLFTAVRVSVVVGQQVGVSLKLHGVTIPNNSLVDLDEILYTAPNTECCSQDPTNANGRHDQTIVCVTDLVDCCDALNTVHGDWYYPDGRRVEFNPMSGATFRANRGSNEVINGRQFYGSVRLYRRYAYPPERGRFRCELPSAADPNVNQTFYANIVDFGDNFRVPPVTISPSGSIGTAGETYSLTCSATTFDSISLPSDVPSPTFEWFFGPNGTASLPSGVTPTPTMMDNGTTYTSTLQFSPLSQYHAGMYICRIGTGTLASSSMVTVNNPPITVMITPNLNEPLMVGQIGCTLTCDVSGADNLNPTITYQWTRDDGSTQTLVGTNSNTLTLSPLRLSNTGDYTCSVTVSSTLLNNDIMMSASNPQKLMVQIPDPRSISLTSNPVTPIINGHDVMLICTVKLSQEILDSEIFFLMVDTQLSQPDGTLLTLISLTVTGTTFTYTTKLNSFGRSNSGNYTCTATVRPQPTSTYLTGTGMVMDTARITTGVYISIQNRKVSNYANNSNIHITDIGEGDCGALFCYTDLTECCRDSDTPGALGQWYYPNGSAVGVISDRLDFYVDRGPSVVRLNRRNDAISTTGQFCCEILDATTTNIRICVNIDAPQSEQVSTTTCTSEVAIGVITIIVIECLLAAPIIAVVLALCWKRTNPTSKNTNLKVLLDGGGVREVVYEEPDKLRAIATTAPENFELTENPTYGVPTTMNKLQPQPHMATESQGSDYELL